MAGYTWTQILGPVSMGSSAKYRHIYYTEITLWCLGMRYMQQGSQHWTSWYSSIVLWDLVEALWALPLPLQWPYCASPLQHQCQWALLNLPRAYALSQAKLCYATLQVVYWTWGKETHQARATVISPDPEYEVTYPMPAENWQGQRLIQMHHFKEMLQQCLFAVFPDRVRDPSADQCSTAANILLGIGSSSSLSIAL